MRTGSFLRLPFWALLVPLVYAPSLLLGAPPSPLALVVLVGSTALAATAVWLGVRTTVLDRVAVPVGHAAPALLLLAIAAYVAVSLYLVREGLRSFTPQLSQLGLYTQSMWTTLHGQAFANTHETVDGSLGSHFGVHFSPTLLLLLPFYALWPSPLVLMGALAFAVALSVVPLYQILKPNAGAPGALVLSLALLALPAFAVAGVHDFHDAAFLPVLLLTAFWALENGRTGTFALASLLALGVREDTGLVMVALGAYALVRGIGAMKGLAIAAFGALWLVVVSQFVMPHFWSPGLWTDPSRFVAQHFGRWGSTPSEVVRGVAAHPAGLLATLASGDSARYLYTLLRPTLVVPMLGDLAWLGGVPHLLVNLLSAKGWQRDAGQYYALVPLLFGFLAAARTASRLPGPGGRGAEPRRSGVGLAVGLVVLAGVLPSLTLPGLPWLEPGPPAAAAAAVVRVLPERGALYVPVGLYPAVAARDTVGCWESLGTLGRAPEMHARYRWIVLWPAGDPPREPHDAPLAAALAADRRFEPVPGYAPLVVYRRR